MDSSSAGEANIIQQLSNIDFDASIKVDVIFEDSDDEQESSKIKQEILMLEPTVNKRVLPNSENHTTNVHNKCLSQSSIQNSPEGKDNRKRKLENEDLSPPKVVKTEDTVKVESVIKKEKNETETVTTPSCQPSAILPKNNEEINESNDTHITAYVSNLLKAVSRHLILILTSYYKYREARHNKDLAEKSYQDFLRVRSHFFNLSFCTVANIILPEINNNNRMFISKFLFDTASLAAEKDMKFDIKTQLGPLFSELINWTRRKNTDTDEIDTRAGPVNVNYVQPGSENSELRQHINQLPIQKNINDNGNVQMPVNTDYTQAAFSSEAKSADANSSKSVLFESGPPGRRISICLDKSPTCSVKDSKNVTPNVTINEKQIPQPYQKHGVQEQQMQMLQTISSNLITLDEVNQRIAYLQQQQASLQQQKHYPQQTSLRHYNFSNNLPPPYPANNASYLAAEQRQYSYSNSSQYARPNMQQDNYQKQMSQNSITRNAQSSSNLPPPYTANNTSHSMPEQRQPSSTLQQNFQQENYQKQMSQYLLSKNVQFSAHLPSYPAQNISNTTNNSVSSLGQWQNYQQQFFSNQVSTNSDQMSPRNSATRPSKAETLTDKSQQIYSQIVNGEFRQNQNQTTQCTEKQKPPLVTPTSNFSFQTEFSSFLRPDEPHSQSISAHATGAQIMQPLQVEPSNAEISRSESTDSGFMSPLNFFTNETNKDQTEEGRTCTPVITHITSLNPAASYIDEGNCCVCRKVTRKMCLGCYKKYYCSADCQRIDWSTHMAICTLSQSQTSTKQ